MVKSITKHIDYVRRSNHLFLKINLTKDNPHFNGLINLYRELDNLSGTSNLSDISRIKSEIREYTKKHIDPKISPFSDVFLTEDECAGILIELN